jgi:tRNA (guanine6-N2)-methyltransferase
MHNLFSLTSRGLEEISLLELKSNPSLFDISSSYRCICAKSELLSPALLNYKTIDDIFLELLYLDKVLHTREMLSIISDSLAEIDYSKALSAISQVRQLPSSISFSVSASFIGKRNYTSIELKESIKNGIKNSNNWEYQEDERLSDLNIRIFIVHDEARIGIRLAKRPLHEREYKKVHIKGSLKPPIAAAMLKLGSVSTGEILLDPFCGAGTIIAEASQLGARCYGSDIDSNAIAAALENFPNSVKPELKNIDARSLSFNDDSIDKIVTNLPWDNQIKVNQEVSQFYTQVTTELGRVLSENGTIVLLTTHPELIKFKKLQLTKEIEISLFGETPSILVYAR